VRVDAESFRQHPDHRDISEGRLHTEGEVWRRRNSGSGHRWLRRRVFGLHGSTSQVIPQEDTPNPTAMGSARARHQVHWQQVLFQHLQKHRVR
jgi:hypothetical protein